VKEQWVLLKDPHNEWWASLLESCQKVCAHAISNMAHDIKYDFLHAWTFLEQQCENFEPITTILKYLKCQKNMDIIGWVL
jgi:hypothetical protein